MQFIRFAFTFIVVLSCTHLAQSVPLPLIYQPLVPSATAPGGPAFTLTVNGTGFVARSIVHWNGVALATRFISSSQLRAKVAATAIAMAGTVEITVVSPGQGHRSNPVLFPVSNSSPSAGLVYSAQLQVAAGSDTVIAADLTGDGTMDLTLCCSPFGLVAFYKGNGDGTFGGRTQGGKAVWTPSIAAGDFNRDGKLDLATPGQGVVYVLLGNGDGTFGPRQGFATKSDATNVTAADFNGDGNLDVAVTYFQGGGNSMSLVSVLLGNGDGTLGPSTSFVTAFEPYGGLTAGDFDRDGKLDLAISTWDKSVSILLGKGDGTFQSKVDYPTDSFGRVLTADFNRDGVLDLVLSWTSNGISLLLGNGDGTFRPYVEFDSGIPNAEALAIADLNADGKLDLVTAIGATENYVGILLGNGDGTFQSPLFSSYQSLWGAITVGDFNGDGKIDVASGGGTVLVQP